MSELNIKEKETQVRICKRDSSFELLIIISMLMILFHHFACHGLFHWQTNEVTLPQYWYNFIIMGGKIGVNVFVLISGYFLISTHKKGSNLKKMLKLWGQVMFYSVSIYVFACIFGISDWNVKDIITSFFPITFESWWFASTYFVLFLLHPFLNKFLTSLEKKEYRIFLVLILICWSVIPTFTTKQFQGNDLLWFITLYAVAGYIKLHGLSPGKTTRYYLALYIASSVLAYVLCSIFSILGTRIDSLGNNALHFYRQESVLMLLSSVALFMVFQTMRMKYFGWINVIASATFGVYLIHDSNILRPVLWLELFKNAQYKDTLALIPYSIIVVLMVFIICTGIDLLRQITIERFYLLLVERYYHKLIRVIDRIKTRIL